MTKSEFSRYFSATDVASRNETGSVTLLTKNFQAIVTVSRFVGCHPHPIFSGNSLETTKIGKLWSIVWIVVVTTMFGFALRDAISCKFALYSNIVNRIAVLTGYAICSILPILRAEEYERAIASIRDFDDATEATVKFSVLENCIAVGLPIVSWIGIVWLFGENYEDTVPMTVVHVFGVCVVSLEVYKFCFVFASVLRRFVLLRRITASGKIDIVSTNNDIYHQPLTVQSVFGLHYRLAEAVENLNRYYDVQIVYWLGYFISDLIIQAYIIVNVPEGSVMKSSARIAFSIYCSALICGVSHFTCKRANELGQLLYGYKAPAIAMTVSSLENFELGFWLFQQPLKITGFKLFCVDLPLLLSMIEASATYAAFIFQSAFEEHKREIELGELGPK